MDRIADLAVLNLYRELLPRRSSAAEEIGLDQLKSRLQSRVDDWQIEVIQRKIPELIADGDLMLRSNGGRDYVRLSARGRRSYHILRGRHSNGRERKKEYYLMIASLAATAVFVAFAFRELAG